MSINNPISRFSLPDLVEIQRASFCWFLEEGLAEEIKNFSPSLRILWELSRVSLDTMPSILPVPSLKLIKVSGLPFLSLICLTLFIKHTSEALFVSFDSSLIFFDLIFLILFSI